MKQHNHRFGHTCRHCGQNFGDRHNLYLHIRTHAKTKATPDHGYIKPKHTEALIAAISGRK